MMLLYNEVYIHRSSEAIRVLPPTQNLIISLCPKWPQIFDELDVSSRTAREILQTAKTILNSCLDSHVESKPRLKQWGNTDGTSRVHRF